MSVRLVPGALALSLLLCVSPSLAAKKDVGSGKEFRAAMAQAQVALRAGNEAGFQSALSTAAPLATTPDDRYYHAALRYSRASATGQRDQARRAVVDMLSSQSSLVKNPGELNRIAAILALQAGDERDAMVRFAEADRLGLTDPDALLAYADLHARSKRPAVALGLADRAVAATVAAGGKPPESWYLRGVALAVAAKQPDDVGRWTRMQVKAYPTAENWRSALSTYRDAAKLDGQAQLDLVRLMRLTKSLAGERDFSEYAVLANERALPGETKASIEEGYASGAVPKTNKSVNSLLVAANKKITADRAALAKAEKQAATESTGKAAKGSADGYLGYGEDAKAISLYQVALQKGGIDADEVNTRLGIAQARSGQKDAARATFARVTGPRSEVARFWTLWLDTTA